MTAWPAQQRPRPPLIETVELRRDYDVGGRAVRALDGVSLTIERGDFVAIMGRSGSGKSTFLNVLGCLDTATGGCYRFDGAEITDLRHDERARLRNRTFGFVFQNFHLLPRTTAQENVELPLLYAGTTARVRRRRAERALDAVGLASWARHTPAQLSGGQQQRVAIARALVNDPLVLLADEPTGALDSQTGADVMQILRHLNRQGVTIVLVTHEAAVASHAKRVIAFSDGRVVDERNNGKSRVPSIPACADAMSATMAGAKTERVDHAAV